MVVIRFMHALLMIGYVLPEKTITASIKQNCCSSYITSSSRNVKQSRNFEFGFFVTMHHAVHKSVVAQQALYDYGFAKLKHLA